MRLLPCSLLIIIFLFTQHAAAPKLFPIPENMRYEFRGARLADMDAKLLKRSFMADLEDDCEDEKPWPDLVAMADISLGKLGRGVVLKVNSLCLCGTGGCPIYVYVREKDGYRTVAKSFGWAFGVVPSNSEVPDLAFASSVGSGQMSLILLGYNGRVYTKKACETLVAKEGFPRTSEDWFNPATVQVRPCE
jgi:hypothetical protein